MAATPAHNMKYRYLGDSGLLVSKFSFGSWMMLDLLPDLDKAYEILVHAFKHGINFFDNAEIYVDGFTPRRSWGRRLRAALRKACGRAKTSS